MAPDKRLLTLTLGMALANVARQPIAEPDPTAPKRPSKPPVKGDTPVNKPIRKFTDARKAEKARRKKR